MDHIQGFDRNQIQMLSLEQLVEKESFARIIPLTYAVTGIREPTDWPNELNNNDVACNKCWYGDGVDFAVIMQDQDPNNNLRTTLSVTCDGDIPRTVSGSSAATSSFARMAALVWSAFPTLTKNDIVVKLQNNASNYINPNNDFDYGFVNVFDACQ